MPLAASKSGLEQAIKQAFLTQKTSNEADGSNPTANIDALARTIANAIHEYVTSAQVDVTQVVSTVPPGVLVSTSGSPVAQVGATVSPGVAQHAGFGRLL